MCKREFQSGLELFQNKLRHLIDDPAVILFADRGELGVRSRVHKIDRVRNAVLDREFDRVQVVAESRADRSHVLSTRACSSGDR